MTTYFLVCTAVVMLLVLTAVGKVCPSERATRMLFAAFNFLIASGVALARALIRGSGGAVVSGDTNDDEGVTSTTKVLPATGGILPMAGLISLVTIAGGLAVRSIVR